MVVNPVILLRLNNGEPRDKFTQAGFGSQTSRSKVYGLKFSVKQEQCALWLLQKKAGHA